MPLILETERLLLRPFQDGDLQSFAAYRADPLVAEYQDWPTPYTQADAAQFVAEMKEQAPFVPGQWYQLALEVKEGGAMIGDCAFYILADDPRQAEIGFTLAQAYQGQGYAQEAGGRLLAYLFGERELHRVRAICDVENDSSIKLLERLGMRREAQFVECLWFKGRWSSEYWYGMLRREWLEAAGTQNTK